MVFPTRRSANSSIRTEHAAIDELAEQAYGMRFVDAPAALRLASSALERSEGIAYTGGVARALVARGASRCRTADLPGASSDLRRAWHLLQSEPDSVSEARVLCWQGSLAMRRAEYSDGMRLGAGALARFRAAGDRQGEADALHMIGSLHVFTGDVPAALEMLERSRRIREDIGDPHGVSICVHDAARALAELGEHESARTSFQEALAWFRASGFVRGETVALLNLGFCCREMGDLERAREYLDSSLVLSRQTGDALPEARALFYLGGLYHATGHAEQALRHCVAAEALARTLGDRLVEIGAAIGAGRARVTLGEPQLGLEMVTAALCAAEEAGYQGLSAEAHQVLAAAYEQMGDAPSALSHFRRFHQLRETVQRTSARLRSRHRAELADLERSRREAELQALKAQLQPHFLLNALNSLAALIRTRPEQAERMLCRLGDLLRLSLEQSAAREVTLADEIAFTTAYLEVERARHGDRFTFVLCLDARADGCAVPHLMVQPLVENAIRHGFGSLRRRGEIEIRSRLLDAERMLVSVRDDGVGLPAGWSLEQAGVGLGTTARRLQQMYGAEHAFRIGAAPGGGTLAEIVLPVRVAAPHTSG